MSMQARINKAVADQEANLDSVLAKHFPEATSGDVDPGAYHVWNEALRSLIEDWVTWNIIAKNVPPLEDNQTNQDQPPQQNPGNVLAWWMGFIKEDSPVYTTGKPLPPGRHAICKDCNQEMKPGTTCTPWTHYERQDGKQYMRIPHTGPGNCGDCNTPPAGIHHFGCDTERCPVCSGQLGMGCDCPPVLYLMGGPKP